MGTRPCLGLPQGVRGGFSRGVLRSLIEVPGQKTKNKHNSRKHYEIFQMPKLVDVAGHNKKCGRTNMMMTIAMNYSPNGYVFAKCVQWYCVRRLEEYMWACWRCCGSWSVQGSIGRRYNTRRLCTCCAQEERALHKRQNSIDKNRFWRAWVVILRVVEAA